MVDLDLLWKEWDDKGRPPRGRDAIISEAGPLLRSLVSSMPTSSEHDRDDLWSEAQVGFLHALEQYDPERGVKLWSYAQQVARGHVLDQMRRHDSLPRSARRRVSDLVGADEFLTAKLRRAPTDSEVAGHLGISVRAVDAARRDYLAGQAAKTLADEPRSSHDVAAEAGDDLEYSDAVERLANALSALEGVERVVMALYYIEELGMKAIGDLMGVSPAMVSKIRDRAMRRIIETLRHA